MTPAIVAGTTTSADGTPIAWFRSGDGPPLVLVHGATADHTAWRTAGPLLATSHTLYAIDRRGRGASGDTATYAIAREYEDVAAIVDAVALAEGRPVDVVGHSFGGRVGLGAALLTPHLRRLVVYEGAPAPDGRSFHGTAVMNRLETLAADDDRAGLLAYFLATVVGMTTDELAAYRLEPTWRARVEAAPTIVREMWAEATEEAGPERYAGFRSPVLQLIGSESGALFTDGTWALDRLLPNGRVVVIPGARHAAHHTHPERFVHEVRTFLHDPTLEPIGRGPTDDPGHETLPHGDGRPPGDIPFEHD
ncbi:MAG: alpha/beta hydrolase [Chloroflexota bacterium]|nr:alpha/beta hydrolase [Chloroflexota bacterium]